MPKILIVEDDEQLQQVLEMTLKRHGYEVHGSTNGVDAMVQASSLKPDLIVLDLMMPLASGDAVLGFLRSTESLKQTRVLVVSAHPKAAALADQLDADGFLAKPVEMQTLCSTIDQLLDPETAG